MTGLKIKSIKPLGKNPVYNISMKSDPHNYLIFDENKNKAIVSLNSHSVAYTYLSSRLLWLKAHYLLEFYAAILMCETKEDKIKEYKRDAFKHNIEVERLDLNKSKETFSIVDEKIYYGFSHVKGIGEEVARKIVENQPYKSFEDFLIRFGTDASVVKPLLGLDVFSCFNKDKIKLYRFYECYKDWKKKKDTRNKRVDESIIKQQGFLNDLLKDNLELAKFEEECYEAWKQFDKNEEIYEGEEEVIDLEYLTKKYKVKRLELREMLEQDAIPLEDIKYIKRPKFRKFNLYNELWKVKKKRERTLEDISYKISRENIVIPKMDKMIDEDWYIESELIEVLTNKEKAELQYYGFLWQHPLEKSPDFQGGLTIERFLQEAEMEGLANGPIEVVILEVEEKLSKNNVAYCTLLIEDSSSQTIRMVMWNDDFKIFKDDLKPGNFVRIRAIPPNNGFRSLTFYSPPKRDRHRLVPKNRADDLRLIVLRKLQDTSEVDLNSFKMVD